MRRLIFHQLGRPAGEGERTGSRIKHGCVCVSVRAAGGLELCPSQGESLGAALDEQEGRPDQTLAPAAQMGILPLPAAWCEHHHVPHLLQGTPFIRHTWCEAQTNFIGHSFPFLFILDCPNVPVFLFPCRCSTVRITSFWCFNTTAVLTAADPSTSQTEPPKTRAAILIDYCPLKLIFLPFSHISPLLFCIVTVIYVDICSVVVVLLGNCAVLRAFSREQ